MVREEGRWEVRWSATGLHPNLGENQTFALRADAPPRASVNELGGSDVLRPGFLYNYALDAKAAGADLMPTATTVADALRRFDPTMDAQRLAETASSSATPIDLITLRQSDRDAVAPIIGGCPVSSSRPAPTYCRPTTASRPTSSNRSRSPSSTSSTDRRAGASSASIKTAATSTCSMKPPGHQRLR